MNYLVKINFNIDGDAVSFKVRPDARLLDIIRKDAKITAVREGCGEGECGACSILLEGKLVNSCSTPAINAHGKTIITSQGFSKTQEYKLIEDSFAEAGAVQCGFCTPGFIMATAALLMQIEDPNELKIKTALSGNLCRCTGYTMIIDAVKIAAKKLKTIDKPFFEKIKKASANDYVKNTDADDYIPGSVKEALLLIQKGYKPIAGGTDFLVRRHSIMKESGNTAILPKIFSTEKIDGFSEIRKSGNSLIIGAATKISDIINNTDLPFVLKTALSSIASPGIRNAGTLAGNICNASPAGDSIPALFVLDANIFYYEQIDGKPLLKEAKIHDFITGPGKTILTNGIVSSINIKLQDECKYIYKKLGTRAANALSKLSIAVCYSKEGKNYKTFKLAIGACAPRVLQSIEAEELIINGGIEKLEAAMKIYSNLLTPIDDQRSTAEYRKNTALKLIKDIIINPGKYSC